MGKKFKALFIGAILAMVMIGILPMAAMAAQTQMSAEGNITNISGTVGFPAGDSGKYKVTSRTVSGTFISGDLEGDYSFTYKANVDLNSQSGNISGQLINGSNIFDIWGTSYPVQWAPSAESPLGFIGTSTASGEWKGHGWPGSGTFSCTFSFVPTLDGHIDYILPGSTFNMNGQWNLK